MLPCWEWLQFCYTTNNNRMEPKPGQGSHQKLAEALGVSRKMPTEEKAAFLETHGRKIFTNYDFVAPETYQRVFSSTDLEGKNIVLAGAGYPFDGSGASNLTKALGKIKQNTNIIPLDISHTRARGWLLVDEDKKGDERGPELSPVVADATSLPFADNSIAGYVSANLINEPNKEMGELRFVKNLIEEAFRVLAPGGFLVLSSFGYFKYTDKTGHVFYNDNIDIEEMVPTELIEKILASTGFTKIEKLPLDEMEALGAIKNKRATVTAVEKVQIIDACGYVAYK